MNTRTKEEKFKIAQQKRHAETLLFIGCATIAFWLAYEIASSSRCDFTGSKLAIIIVPVCAAMGNVAAATIPFLFGCISLLFTFWSPFRRRTTAPRK
jgi:hypothetical protein